MPRARKIRLREDYMYVTRRGAIVGPFKPSIDHNNRFYDVYGGHGSGFWWSTGEFRRGDGYGEPEHDIVAEHEPECP